MMMPDSLLGICRRPSLRAQALGAFTLAAILIGGHAVAAPATATATPPNVILIIADDMGYGDIGPFGSKVNRTPHLDRLAQEGMRLTSFYAAPVCTPSRAQLLTGCYAKRVSLPDVIFPACPIGLSTNEVTLPKLLQQRGYATMAIGKWHVGDQPAFLPTRHGFDHYLGLPYSNDMGPAEEQAALKSLNSPASDGPARFDAPGGLGITRSRRPPLPLVRDEQVIENISPSDQDQITARYAEEAVKFIRGHQTQPFFLYLAHTAVHVPLHPGAAFRGRSKNGLFGDWVEEVDWSVGRVMDTLRELKLDQRTLVIFTSDNGPWLTMGTNGGVATPLRGGKTTTWEGGVREPTIAWWPGAIAAGSSNDAVMANFDLLPTFASLAGATLPQDRKIDGANLWPLLSGQSSAPVHEAFYYFNGNRLEAVRSGPWKLAIHDQGGGAGAKKAAGQPLRLYNLNADIGETKDVAAQNPEVVQRLEKRVAEMDADLGASKQGPGVRPPGRVAQPQPMVLPGASYLLGQPTGRN